MPCRRDAAKLRRPSVLGAPRIQPAQLKPRRLGVNDPVRNRAWMRCPKRGGAVSLDVVIDCPDGRFYARTQAEFLEQVLDVNLYRAFGYI